MTESCKDLQLEELAVLQSIYEGDSSFVERSDDQIYQYKFGEDGDSKSFIIQFKWVDDYPLEKLPEISMDAFYNSHLTDSVKSKISNEVLDQAGSMLGFSMTYSLIEWVKDNRDRLTEDQSPDVPHCTTSEIASSLGDLTVTSSNTTSTTDLGTVATKVKKEHMSKQQKRRAWDRIQAGTGGSSSISDRPRGWDWVDIVRHLSQTGSANS